MKDIIQDVLDTVRFKSAIYFKHGFCGNWGLDIPKGDFAQFHFVADGVCVLDIEDQSMNLSKGDLVIFPKGHAHKIKAYKDADCKPGPVVLTSILGGQDPFGNTEDINSTLVCGHYELDRSVSHFILENLPSFIVIKNEEYKRFDRIGNILGHILDEISEQDIGYPTIITRLAEILLISILRHYYTRQSLEEVNLFKDELIYKVINYIHKNISNDLSIDTLSRQSGISRTSFIQRFKKTVGNPPLVYIKNWRLTKAKQMLLHTNMPLVDIGDEIGYSSPSAFNRVFKSTFNISPKKFRATRKYLKIVS